MEQTLERCYHLLVAMKTEIEKLSQVPHDEQAAMMATMKINLVAYIQHIWPSRSVFEEDLANLEAAQQAHAADRVRMLIRDR